MTRFMVIKFILKRAFRSLLTKDVILFLLRLFSHSASVLPLLSRKYHSMIILVPAWVSVAAITFHFYLLSYRP
jgi:hypothetical protein